MNFPAELLKQCWFLTGPTAVGKTATALNLAKRLNAEILSLDSMAVYRRMDIGTAKPDQTERAAVPHHLIDLAEPHQDFSVTEYVTAALSAVEDVIGRGRVPLFSGGTGLYLKAILRGIYNGPPANWDLRNRLEEQTLRDGPQQLHDQLMAVDPTTATRLHINDQRRIIRALEVYAATGLPLSQQHHNVPRPLTERPAAVVWLEPPRDWLRDRINRRVDLMMQCGLLKETQTLLAATPLPGRTARQALGYRELIAHLEDNQPLEDAVELIKIGTRQFAKRQHTWFRNMEECSSFPVTGDESADQLAECLLQRFSTM